MTDAATDLVRVDVIDDVGLITLSSPPVNALARPLREAIIAATDQLNATPGVRVIAVLSDRHVFSAGADIREFSRPLRRPYLQDVCANLEASQKPVVAVLHGAAFGGGLGIAMASHARVALPGTRLGLTEVHVGILPGAGGTQRTPRLTGVSTAIDLIVSGRKFDATEGVGNGIIDRIMPGTPREVALQAARDVLSGALPTRRTGQIPVRVDPAVIAAATRKLAADRWASAAQHKAIEAIAHAGLPLAEGILRERAMVLELLQGPERQALAHAQMAERMARQIPEAGIPPRPTATAAVIGTDEVAIGFAAALLQAGVAVTSLCAPKDGTADLHTSILHRAEVIGQAGAMPPADTGSLMARLTVTPDLTALRPADIVVIAATHDVRATMARLDPILRPGVVIGVLTIGDDLATVINGAGRAGDIVGLHAVPSRLLEVQIADRTAPDVVATVFALAARMRIVAVRNLGRPVSARIQAQGRRYAGQLLVAGVQSARLDRLIADAGLGASPLTDLDPAHLSPPSGIAAPLTDDGIVARYRAAMILEACRALEQGEALRPGDIDAALLGHGFRRTLGGLFHAADRIGLPALVAQIDGWSAEAPDFWHIPGLLRQLAGRNGYFADLNKEQTRGS